MGSSMPYAAGGQASLNPRGGLGAIDRVTRAFDRRLRRLRGIYEFSRDPGCIYRLSVERASRDTALPDGTVFRRGDPVGVLHLWGEHVPAIPPAGADLAWAARMARALYRSTALLALHASEEPSLRSIPAFGNHAFLTYTPATLRLLERLGFAVLEEVPEGRVHRRAWWRIARFWTWCLRRTFNRRSVAGVGPGDLRSRPVWMSRRTLLGKYAGRGADSP